jgi:hypothetical protein
LKIAISQYRRSPFGQFSGEKNREVIALDAIPELLQAMQM